MTKNKDFQKKDNDTKYDEAVRKKLDEIIEQASIENSALKKILESFNDDDLEKGMDNKKNNIHKNKKK